ncbi:MAG TPA: hypothetical protein VMC07_01320 [Candidatus Omnitrophota bacterium]|nr:hypothetical protein [Candidatus Omnitrophota bacterium]
MKIKRKNLVTLFIIIGILILAGIIIYFQAKPGAGVSPQIAACIGKHSIMYSQTGCHYCKQQKELFGNSVQYLNITECDINSAPCTKLGIQATPTWIINGTWYVGVQPIEKLQNLTGCY